MTYSLTRILLCSVSPAKGWGGVKLTRGLWKDSFAASLLSCLLARSYPTGHCGRLTTFCSLFFSGDDFWWARERIGSDLPSWKTNQSSNPEAAWLDFHNVLNSAEASVSNFFVQWNMRECRIQEKKKDNALKMAWKLYIVQGRKRPKAFKSPLCKLNCYWLT